MFVTNTLEELQRGLKSIDRAMIIVEGKNDKKVLGTLGFANVHAISGKSLYNFVEEIKSDDLKSALILTDFDEEGEEKNSQLTHLLQSEGVFVNSFMRKKFKRLLKVHRIEEVHFLKLLEDDYHGKACSVYDKIFNRSQFHMRRNGGKTRCDRGDIRSNRRIARG